MRRFVATAVVIALGTTFVEVAAADTPPSSNAAAHEKAAAAFQEGRRLIEAGNCDLAVPKLRESLDHESSIGARLSIADCVEKHDPLAAWRVLKEAAALSLLNRDERLATAEQRAAGLQNRLAIITFKLPSGAEHAGFELRVDGDLVDRYLYRTGYATTPGRHVVEATAGGAASPRRFVGSVNVEAGVQASVDVDLRRDECKTSPAAAATHVDSAAPTTVIDRGAPRRTLGLALGGFGLAGIASGVVFGLLTLDKKSAIEGACGGSVGNCAAPQGSVDAETEAAKTTAALSTVSFIVGGTALLGGAVLYLTAPSAPGATPKTGGVRVSPQATRSGGGLGISGSF